MHKVHACVCDCYSIVQNVSSGRQQPSACGRMCAVYETDCTLTLAVLYEIYIIPLLFISLAIDAVGCSLTCANFVLNGSRPGVGFGYL
jgi:hypothetical protein